MKSNIRTRPEPVFTHEGARAANIGHEAMLRRSVMSCLLWEKEFYESGEDIAKRIVGLVPQCRPEFVAACAYHARTAMKLRHVPLLLVAAMTFHPEHKKLVGKLLVDVVQRADELTEFVAIYYKLGAKKLSNQVKKGLAAAFLKFDAYQLAKYNRDADWKLRDVLHLVHSNPSAKGSPKYTKAERKLEREGKIVPRALNDRETIYKSLVENTLEAPNTWEVRLSSGEDKRAVFTDLIETQQLGAMAMLRNLRNMEQAGVDRELIIRGLQTMKADRVLPFRFVAAAHHAPSLEPFLEEAMFRCVATMDQFEGDTTLLVDHSGSMKNKLSEKSELTRFDAASAVGILLRELCPNFRCFTFSNTCIEVPARRGFALREAIMSRINPTDTYLGAAVDYVYRAAPNTRRLIVITDEQSRDRPKSPLGRGYMINVASNRNGIGYRDWIHIDGWSEGVIALIREYEAEDELR